MQHTIIKRFTDLDNSIIKTAIRTYQNEELLQEKIKKLAPAYSGSYALLSIYNSATDILHMAYTSDSRAVLGQQRLDSSWEVMPLSVDQTSKNQEEVTRLHKEHPKEEIVQNGRVLGITISRTFSNGQ